MVLDSHSQQFVQQQAIFHIQQLSLFHGSVCIPSIKVQLGRTGYLMNTFVASEEICVNI